VQAERIEPATEMNGLRGIVKAQTLGAVFDLAQSDDADVEKGVVRLVDP
jgi:hypothetical protein